MISRSPKLATAGLFGRGMGALRELAAVAAETGREWKRDKVPRLAAALAFYTLFSLAPLLVIAIGVAGYFFGREAARGEVVAQFSGLVGTAGAQAIETLIASTGTPGKGALAAILGLVTLLVGASGVFGELQDALNTIWNVEPKPSGGWRTFLQRRFLSFAMVLGTGFLLLVSLLLSAGLAFASRGFTFDAPASELSWQIVTSVLALLLPYGLFALIFRLVPDAEVAWRDVWLGAFVTAAFFALGRAAIGYYLGRKALDSTFGAAASLVALVFWVYYSAQILFAGAELTQVLGRRRTGRAHDPKRGADRAERAEQHPDREREPEPPPARFLQSAPRLRPGSAAPGSESRPRAVAGRGIKVALFLSIVGLARLLLRARRS